ncbi:MAG: hypothetical protein MUF24_03835 [Chitinophagaceae bacterium]|nr:hypothetical protein [Chitinophagaceae bacterium]
MKKFLIFIFVLCNASVELTAQLEKKNWMLGGNARLASSKQVNELSEVSQFSLDISPSVGYFFADKFAGGVKGQLGFTSLKYNGPTAKSSVIGVGPFLRYYMLSVDKPVNFFGEVFYRPLITKADFNARGIVTNGFTLTGGAVVFLNTSVGLEFTLNYDFFNNSNNNKVKTIFFGVGFQIHLIKE